jgi:hypothetical protein
MGDTVPNIGRRNQDGDSGHHGQSGHHGNGVVRAVNATGATEVTVLTVKLTPKDAAGVISKLSWRR